MEVESTEVDEEVTFRVKDHSASPVRNPLSNISNHSSPRESPVAEGRQQHRERHAVLERNKDVIQAYKRSSLSARVSDQGGDETPPPESTKVRQLERKLAGLREELYRAEEQCGELGQKATHWQRLCEADGVFDEQTSRARYLDKLRKQQNKMEELVDRLCLYVDAESIVQDSDEQAKAKVRAVRKSLETMSTLQEEEGAGEHEDGGGIQQLGGDKEAWKELGLVVRLKREAADKEEVLDALREDLDEAEEREAAANQRVAQLTTENEELNELTVEMQAAHARLLAMAQAVEKQKKEQQQASQDTSASSSAAASALSATVSELEKERDDLVQARDDAETRAERLHSDLTARVGEVAKLRLEADAWVQENGRLELELEHKEEDNNRLVLELEGKQEENNRLELELERKREEAEAGEAPAQALRLENARLAAEATDLQQLLHASESISAQLIAQKQGLLLRVRVGGLVAVLVAVLAFLLLFVPAQGVAALEGAPPPDA